MAGDPPVQASHADPETILNRMTDGFVALDDEWRITFANERGHEILLAGTDSADGDIEGAPLRDLIPVTEGKEFHDHFATAAETQEPTTFEAMYGPMGAWFDVRTYPSDSGLSVYFRDVSEEKYLLQERQKSLNALQQLYAISSDSSRDLDDKIDSLLAVCGDLLDLPNAFLTRIEQGTQYIDRSASTHPEVQVGETCPLDEAYCKRTIELDQLLTVVNASDEGWRDDPAYDRFEFETYIGGRVMVDGDLYGTLCFADTEPRDGGFTDTKRTFVELLTRWIGHELERRAAAEKLKRERDRLDEFASAVSHDLRNPLNTAIGRVEHLETELDNEHLPVVARSLDRIEELIEDLLTLAREGMAVQEATTVRLADIARTAWETTDTVDASLTVTCTGTWVRADEARLRQCFENLFRNAVEHSGPDVSVRVGLLDGQPGFYVADDGEGIPTAQQERVFETGYTTQNAGTGFGLSIVEQIVTAHDWGIDVTTAETGGARFEVFDVELVDDD